MKKTVMTSLEQRSRSVMARKGGREFKKDMKHLRSSMAPNILAHNIGWVEALEVGLHSNVEALLQRAQRSLMNSRRSLQIWPRS